MSEENKPLLSDTMIRSRALAYTSPYDREVQRTANWVREIYEAQRSKDRELIQTLVNALAYLPLVGDGLTNEKRSAVIALALAGEQGYQPTPTPIPQMSELREMHLSELLAILAEVPGDRTDQFNKAIELAKTLEAERSALLRERDEALALLKTMEGEPEITSHESGYQLGVKHGHEQMREIFEGISPRGGEAFLDSSLRYVIALREKIIELQSPSPQSDTLTVDSAMQVVMEWKSLEMNGWSADAIWDNLEHLLTKAAAK